MDDLDTLLADFADNPDPRCSCALLLDTSASMKGDRIKRLNNGLKVLRDCLISDALASKRVDLALITFDSEVRLLRDFGSASSTEIPPLKIRGQRVEKTFLASGITAALEAIELRKQQYHVLGIPYYRPWLYILTDGHPEREPQLALDSAKRLLRQSIERKRVKVFPIGVGDGANLKLLTDLTGVAALRLRDTKFKDLFVWLSSSLSTWSESYYVGTKIPLPPPDWGNTC